MKKLLLITGILLCNLILFAHSGSVPYGIQFENLEIENAEGSLSASFTLNFFDDVTISNDNFTITAPEGWVVNTNSATLVGVHHNQ
jgi:hypothetical protein